MILWTQKQQQHAAAQVNDSFHIRSTIENTGGEAFDGLRGFSVYFPFMGWVG